MSNSTYRIRCAYCTGFVTLKADGFDVDKRSAQPWPTVTCPVCDSKFDIEVSTKRKSKGKRLKAHEAKETAAHAAKVAEVEKANDAIALQLLAEPGCTCADIDEQRGYRFFNRRPDGLENGGTLHGLPCPPRHAYNCPTKKER